MGISDGIKAPPIPTAGGAGTFSPDPVTGLIGSAVGTTVGAVGSVVIGAATGALGGSVAQAVAAQRLQGAERLRSFPGLGSTPQLPAADMDLAKMDEAQSSALLEMLSNKTNEQSIKTLSTEIRGNQARSKQTTDARIKAIQEATQKAMEAANKEGGFFSKMFGFLGKILGPISSVATLVVGAALTATGVGAPLGVFLMAQGAMGVASTVMDIVDKVRESQGKEPIGWRPSFGFFVSKGLQALGVSEQTASWIGVGVEITGAVAAVVATGGAAASKYMAKAGEVASKAISAVKSGLDGDKLMKIAQQVNQATTLVSAGANIGKQAINIQVAGLRKEAELADARAMELKGMVDRLLKQVQENTELIKDFAKRIQEVNESVSDSVQSRTQAGVAMAANMKVTG